MKVAVACDDNLVSPHFGRCQRYLIAELTGTEVKLVQWLDNPGHEPGALPALMHQEQVALVIAGGAGPRAQQLLAQYNIDLLTGVTGEAIAVLQALAHGELQVGESSCDHGM